MVPDRELEARAKRSRKPHPREKTLEIVATITAALAFVCLGAVFGTATYAGLKHGAKTLPEEDQRILTTIALMLMANLAVALVSYGAREYLVRRSIREERERMSRGQAYFS